jgi:Na+/H+-dicarboxylate symporter
LRRRIGTVSIPLALVFGRAGTALITSTAFIVVLGSYSNIGLSFSNVLWVLIAIPPVMVLMGASPGAGPATAVMTLCALFGRGFESGYLLIVPVAAPLIACAVLLDILFVGTVSYLVGIRAGGITEREIRHFI